MPARNDTGMRLHPIAESFVEARGVHVNVIERDFAREVGTKREVNHQLARPVAASAADVGNFERDGCGHHLENEEIASGFRRCRVSTLATTL